MWNIALHLMESEGIASNKILVGPVIKDNKNLVGLFCENTLN
jgi:hypothetical protein